MAIDQEAGTIIIMQDRHRSFRIDMVACMKRQFYTACGRIAEVEFDTRDQHDAWAAFYVKPDGSLRKRAKRGKDITPQGIDITAGYWKHYEFPLINSPKWKDFSEEVIDSW